MHDLRDGWINGVHEEFRETESDGRSQSQSRGISNCSLAFAVWKFLNDDRIASPSRAVSRLWWKISGKKSHRTSNRSQTNKNIILT
jgi:hypothetical protein